MNSKLSKKAFSLIELSVALIIIAVLAAGIMSGKRAIDSSKFKAAQILTKSSPIYSIPDLVMWLEPTLDGAIVGASSGNNLSDGDKVSSWNDISSNKISLTQVTTNNQPTYTKLGINNLPSLTFASANSQRLFSSTAPISQGNFGYTMVAVFSKSSSSSGYVFAQSPSTSTANKQGSIYFTGPGACCFSGLSNDSTPVTIQSNINYIAVVRIDNSQTNNVTTYLNGSSASSATLTPSSLDIGAEIVVVGSRTASGLPLNGSISEVIIFDRALNASEIYIINKYLSKKYNITLS